MKKPHNEQNTKIFNKDKILFVSHPCIFVRRNHGFQRALGSQVHGTIASPAGYVDEGGQECVSRLSNSGFIRTVTCFDCRAFMNIFHLAKRQVDVLISVHRGPYCSFSSGSDTA